ncbi:MAG: ATP-binding cassette domain-containing protein, partial [Pyrinomonadaceae bacterium]|nr:ATP-binding cassette domain-containing protein [Pyrinomonadaceae bacterium]
MKTEENSLEQIDDIGDTKEPGRETPRFGESFFRADRAVPAIEFRNVRLAFDDRKILDDISFKVRKGETKIILGRSGSGKSTTIRLILGLLRPDDGEILIDGEDVTFLSEAEMMRVREKIGMVFQEGALFDSLPVYDNVG